jgi:hypothetical protein
MSQVAIKIQIESLHPENMPEDALEDLERTFIERCEADSEVSPVRRIS